MNWTIHFSSFSREPSLCLLRMAVYSDHTPATMPLTSITAPEASKKYIGKKCCDMDKRGFWNALRQRWRQHAFETEQQKMTTVVLGRKEQIVLENSFINFISLWKRAFFPTASEEGIQVWVSWLEAISPTTPTVPPVCLHARGTIAIRPFLTAPSLYRAWYIH